MPPSVPPPVAIVTRTSTPPCRTGFPAWSSNWMTGCWPNGTPLVAVVAGGVAFASRAGAPPVALALNSATPMPETTALSVLGPAPRPASRRRSRARSRRVTMYRRDAAATGADHPGHGHAGHRLSAASRTSTTIAPAAARCSPAGLAVARDDRDAGAAACRRRMHERDRRARQAVDGRERRLAPAAAERARDRRAPSAPVVLVPAFTRRRPPLSR